MEISGTGMHRVIAHLTDVAPTPDATSADAPRALAAKRQSLNWHRALLTISSFCVLWSFTTVVWGQAWSLLPTPPYDGCLQTVSLGGQGGAVAATQDGEILLSSGKVFDIDGNLLRTAPQGAAGDMAISGSGLIVTANGEIRSPVDFSLQGTLEPAFAAPQAILNIGSSPDGRVLIAGQLGGVIQVAIYNPDLTLLRVWAVSSPIVSPILEGGIAGDSSGDVFVSLLAGGGSHQLLLQYSEVGEYKRTVVSGARFASRISSLMGGLLIARNAQSSSFPISDLTLTGGDVGPFSAAGLLISNVGEVLGVLLAIRFEYTTGNGHSYFTSVYEIPGGKGIAAVNSRTGRLAIYRCGYRSASHVLTDAASPSVSVVNVAPRSGTTFLDIDYVVSDFDSDTLEIWPLAFEDGQRLFAKVVKIEQLVEGTVNNTGGGIPADGQVRRLSWDIGGQMSGSGFLPVRVEVYARDERDELDVGFVTLPADIPEVGDPELTISARPLLDEDLKRLWFYLIAKSDPGIAFASGEVAGNGGALDGQILASDGLSTTAAGRDFVLARFGVQLASVAEVERARKATSPGIQQFDPLKRIGIGPRKVNEIGVDTSSSSGIWLVRP